MMCYDQNLHYAPFEKSVMLKQEFILLTNQKDNVLTKDDGNESY